jgi:haloacetate dehalogenase
VSARVFEGFEEFDVTVSGTTVHGRRGGAGPPLLLLHGIPETHLMWHRVAPALAERYTVVATDLRGYGDSGKPASTGDHAPYAMRELARDQVEAMGRLGYDRFGVAGHDRGARCAYRMALDHPTAVSRLAVLDIVPTYDAFHRADMDFSLGFPRRRWTTGRTRPTGGGPGSAARSWPCGAPPAPSPPGTTP